MTSEYHGGPVAGGTYPALIWKAFMQAALKDIGAEPRGFPSPPYLSVSARNVTWRNGKVELSNGLCSDTQSIVYFTGKGPSRTADCKTNEVEVPNVVGLRIARARTRLSAQPLTPLVIYKPAMPGEPVGVVLKQFPKTGTLASFGRVRLVLAKALHGVVPRIVGLDEQQARTLLETKKLKVTVAHVRAKKGRQGRVLAQKPAGGVAAAPGMTVRITVAAGG
jgi:hypothetical protein